MKLSSINPATISIGFSCPVPGYGKASIRRCSTPTTSIDNAVRSLAQDSLSLYICMPGASRISCLCVLALAKGMTINCKPRLDPEDS